MKRYALAYVVVLVVSLGVDAVWLTLTHGRLYRPLLAHLLADKIALAPAVLFYLIYTGGIVLFAVSPALAAGSWPIAALHGAVLGLCAYATYDLTNQATLRDWPVLITLVDIAWGSALTSIAATIGYLVSSRY